MANHTVPSITEQRLQERIEHLEDDLHHEAGHRHLANEDLADLNARADRMRSSIRVLRADYRHLDRLTTRLLRAAVAGWGTAIALALALITVAS